MRHTLLLAVFDDVSRRELFGKLRNKGLLVVEATTPTQTVERICCFYPEAILLDLKTMKDNLDVCRKLRKVCHRPVIIATSQLDEETKARGFDAGVDNFILKPIGTEELFIQIKQLYIEKL
jgi:DNA-binding response OmpR family regulator